MGIDRKGIASVVAYAVGIPIAFYQPMVSRLLYVAVALMWLVPDSRIEKRMRGA